MYLRIKQIETARGPAWWRFVQLRFRDPVVEFENHSDLEKLLVPERWAIIPDAHRNPRPSKQRHLPPWPRKWVYCRLLHSSGAGPVETGIWSRQGPPTRLSVEKLAILSFVHHSIIFYYIGDDILLQVAGLLEGEVLIYARASSVDTANQSGVTNFWLILIDVELELGSTIIGSALNSLKKS